MPSPIDQVTYNQDAGYLPINLVAGDDLPILVTFPSSIVGMPSSRPLRPRS